MDKLKKFFEENIQEVLINFEINLLAHANNFNNFT